MPEIKFSTEVVDEIPKRQTPSKPSKYDEIVEFYINAKAKNMKIVVEGKKPSYVVTQLNRRIEALEHEGIEATSVNGIVYLTQKEPKPED